MPTSQLTVRHPRTLIEAFPATVEAAQWIEGYRVAWRWARPLKTLITAAAGLAVLALLLVAVTGGSR
jgi:hypothetical protein